MPNPKRLRKELLKDAKDATAFSQLTFLLHLITSLNLDEKLPSSFQERATSASSDTALNLLGFTLLDSIAAILVQRHEVVAVCYTSDKVSVIVAESDVIPATDDDIPVLSPSLGSHTFYPLQLAAISNPDFASENLIPNEYPHHVQIQPEGKSFWTNVRSYEWHCAFLGPSPLGDHVATVSAYLNDLKKQTDSETQSLYSGKFTSYLISACWQSMARRIESWRAIGFIYMINNLPAEELCQYADRWDFSSFEELGPGDRTLMRFLESLDSNTKQSLILIHCNSKDLGFTLSDFEVFPKLNSVSSRSGPQNLLFSKETILEFHKLVIAAFNGFASAFIRLKEEYNALPLVERTPIVREDSDMTKQQNEVLRLLKRASAHYRHLLNLICSSSFKAYFDLIGESFGERALIPSLDYAKILYIPYAQKFKSNTVAKNVEDSEGNLEAEIEAEVEADEQSALCDFGEVEKERLPSFFKFIKMFVIHLMAKRALERHCFRTKDLEVNISLFNMRRSPLAIPAGSWPKMVNILKESFPSDPSVGDSNAAAHVSRVVEILRDKVQTPPVQYSSKSHTLLAALKNIMDEKSILFTGGIHCETVLATLKRYFELFPKDDNHRGTFS